MMWIEKYRPRSFSEMESSRDIVDVLQSYTIETIPHLIINGMAGHGKKTLLYALINHLYGSIPDMKQKKVEIDTSTSKKLEVLFLESDEFIEIDLSEYGYYDKKIAQTIIKQIAQTKPMLTLFKKKSSISTKILVITKAECLSKDAQSALRRTIEMYSATFRLILVCEQLSAIIEPIRSRFLHIRMHGFSQEDTENICRRVLSEEKLKIEENIVSDICKSCNGNLKRALCLLEAHYFNHAAIDSVKRHKVDKPVLRLDWEKKVESVAKLMKREQSSQSLKTIRENTYALLGACIPPRDILLELLHLLLEGTSFETYQRIVEYASIHDERMKLGTKSIVHLESFVASVLVLLSNKRTH